MKLNERIKELRKEKNLSQAKFAKAIKASQKAIDFLEKGINETKSSYIYRICITFGVSADYLLGITDY